MGVSAFRAAACAGVLVGGLMLGDSAIGLAVADPGGNGHVHRDRQSGKYVNSERTGWGHANDRNAGERRRRKLSEPQEAPPATFGSERESGYAKAESTIATLSDIPEPEPELVPDPDREANPDGTDGAEPAGAPGGDVDPGLPPDTGGDGSDYSDDGHGVENTVMSADTVVSAPEPAAQKLDPPIEYQYPFMYYLLQIRRDGGGWWNANQIISRLGQAIMPTPPEPEPAPAPAFRGPRPRPRPRPRRPRPRPRRPRPNPSSTRRVVLPVAVATIWRPTSAVDRCSERRSSPCRSRLRAPSALRRVRRLWRREPD